MEAKNFRIGNFVNAGFKNEKKRSTHEMTGSCILDLYANGEKGVFDYEPIKLNESWLENFGFKRTYFGRKLDDFYMKASSRIVHTDELLGFSYEIIPETKYLKVNYVHELQNLFFAITGDELTVKQEESV